MPDYSIYNSARNSSVSAAISQYSLSTSDEPALQGAFAVGANGGNLGEYDISEGLQDAANQCAQDGGVWSSQNPTTDRPPPPTAPSLA